MKTLTFNLINIFIVYFGMSISAQSPGRQEWTPLVKNSSDAVVGLVESVDLVIRRDKIPLTSGRGAKGEKIATLANPNEYIIGRLVHLRVEKLIKDSGHIKAQTTTSIFLPGRLPTEGKPVLLKQQRYLVLLSPLKANEKEFKGATVYAPNVPTSNEKSFNSLDCYIVVGEAQGVESITDKNKMRIADVIKEIQSITQKGRK